MGAFYGTKIKEGMVNPATGKAWAIGDVPKLWKKKTETWLKENQAA